MSATQKTTRLVSPHGVEGVSADHPLSPGGAPLAVLDANALLPPRLSDLLFDLFIGGLDQPRWTHAIETEFIKNSGAVLRLALHCSA